MSLVNLLPDDYVARQAQKRTNLVCALLFGVVITGVLAAGAVSSRSHDRTREVCERINQAYIDAGKLIRQMQELDASKQKMLGKANLTSGLIERVPRSYVLATITNALPKGASLTKFELTTERIKKPAESAKAKAKAKSKFQAVAAKRRSLPGSSTKTKVSIKLTGLAGTDVEVARFITLMARCPLVETIDLIYSQEKEVDDVISREFQVVLHLKGDADVLGPPDGAEVSAGPARPKPVRAGSPGGRT